MLLFGFIGLMLDLAFGGIYFLFKIALYMFPIVFLFYIFREVFRRDY